MRLSILAQAASVRPSRPPPTRRASTFLRHPTATEPPASNHHLRFPSVVTLHVFADTSGLPGGGRTGAEFAIRGLDEGNPPAQPYYTEWRPNPQATITLGDPLGSGVNVAFADCQTGQFILLGSLVIINTGDTELRKLQITARQPPNNANFDCPLLVHCGRSLLHSAVCVGWLCVSQHQQRSAAGDQSRPAGWCDRSAAAGHAPVVHGSGPTGDL